MTTDRPDSTAVTISRSMLEEIADTMRHARTFIKTREKMHPTGQQLYDELLERLEAAIGDKEESNRE